jgi:hypothetical protein
VVKELAGLSAAIFGTLPRSQFFQWGEAPEQLPDLMSAGLSHHFEFEVWVAVIFPAFYIGVFTDCHNAIIFE